MSEPQTMLEKVARAIADSGSLGVTLAYSKPQDTDTETIRRCREADTLLALNAARAALEAMREPTEGMKTAGMEAQSEEHWPDPWPLAKDGYELAPDYITAGLVWWHMITAALEGK